MTMIETIIQDKVCGRIVVTEGLFHRDERHIPLRYGRKRDRVVERPIDGSEFCYRGYEDIECPMPSRKALSVA